MNNDPDYVKRLAQLPEAERNALLYGSWDSFEGQVFTEWIDNREHYKDRRWTHVIEPFKIPQSWRIIRSYDWGYTRPFSVGWTAVDQDGRFYRIRELYGCKKNQPNTGVRWPIEKVAQEILAIEIMTLRLRADRYTVLLIRLYSQNRAAEKVKPQRMHSWECFGTRATMRELPENAVSFTARV